MKYCSECASPLLVQIPPGDNRERHVCPTCGTIHYQNPKVVVGAIPVWENDGEIQILLCRRAIEPRCGYWTLPAGFMENGETTGQAAMRETEEEAGARIALQDLFSILNVPHVQQVHLFYRARLLDLNVHAGSESQEVRLFSESAIPWEDLAFPTVEHTLKSYFADLKKDDGFGLHAHDIFHPLRRPR